MGWALNPPSTEYMLEEPGRMHTRDARLFRLKENDLLIPYFDNICFPDSDDV